MEIRQLQELLLAVLPQWNYRIAKPLKQLLDEGVSLEMYYCIQTLRWGGGRMTMSELAHWGQMPKQQMTKLVNRLVERGFVERVYDPSDRRIIRIQITGQALDYIDHFLKEEAGCFRSLLEPLSEEDREEFRQGIESILHVLSKLPRD